ncbi:MAG: hypothetical protein JNL74_18590 [Fibrobacteres bacterium]|nr:hypothetical protein [Fibrobacterota bacterium]
MANKLITIFFSLILALMAGCDKNGAKPENGASIAPRMLFKTAEGSQSFIPPATVRNKAEYVEIDINASNGEQFQRKIPFSAGYMKIDDIAEGTANVRIKILDGLNVVLMEGAVDVGISADKMNQIPLVYMNPVIPVKTNQPYANQICISKMRITFDHNGIFNFYTVKLYDGSMSLIREFEAGVAGALRDINGNRFIVDTFAVSPAKGTKIHIAVVGHYREDNYNSTSQESEPFALTWNEDNPCDSVSSLPVLYNARILCQQQVELTWGPNDVKVDGFLLILEKEVSLNNWVFVFDKPLELWRDYKWDGSSFVYVSDHSYNIGEKYRYSIKAMSGKALSIRSNFREFTIGNAAPASCP